jgi:DNA-directed RNA polymerase specialized sigma subunit
MSQIGIPEWQKWKERPEPANLSAALKSVNHVIDEVPRANPGLNRNLLRGQAKQRAVEAFSSFDPSMGASLETHVRNHLKPLTMRAHGQTRAISRGRFVEETATEFKNEFRTFEEQFNREPTAAEMADRMKIGVPRAKQLMERSSHYEIPESQIESLGAVEGSEDSDVGRWTEYVYHDLPPRNQLIMDLRLGRNGKKKLGLEEIAGKVGMSAPAVHKILNRIADQILSGVEGGKG